ncbi:two-component system regulatory protein YycI [Anoxynatronum sibiricum]|uniref:Two-component system regulatory protein YycI n=1 Tax=Anoxynatronum sibiricum TaxID=210623 RepID=A0ABU9VSJ2_9CLOT
MDWTKAKSILIAAFLVTNLLLGAALLTDPTRQQAAGVSEAYLQQTLAFLEDENVVLETPLPRQTPSLSAITVTYRFFENSMITRLLGDDWEQIAPHTYQSTSGQVTITNDKLLAWQPAEPLSPPPDLREETLETVSQALLENYDFSTGGLTLSQIYLGMVPEYDAEPLHKLVYEQTYQGRFVGESYVHVYMNQRGVVAVEALLLEDPAASDQTGTPRVMISAPEALLRKLDEIGRVHRGEGPVVVSRVEAGYYFALTRDPFTQWESVASGTAVPAWKIVLKNGTTFYQEAF